MTPQLVEGYGCPYEGCGMAVEVTAVRGFHSSDPLGHTLVVFYQCVQGHKWVEPAEATA